MKQLEIFRLHISFCNGGPNEIGLLLRKGVYPYEYMDSWEKFNETSIPPKEAYYSKLNEEDVSDVMQTMCMLKKYGTCLK